MRNQMQSKAKKVPSGTAPDEALPQMKKLSKKKMPKVMPGRRITGKRAFASEARHIKERGAAWAARERTRIQESCEQGERFPLMAFKGFVGDCCGVAGDRTHQDK